MSRAYTVEELDDLRWAVRERLQWGNANGPNLGPGESMMSYSYSEKGLEEQVRTHMLAGHTGDDLRKADK